MTMKARLHTILEEQDCLLEGQSWRFWTEPQRVTAVSYDDAGIRFRPVRRRRDGQPDVSDWDRHAGNDLVTMGTLRKRGLVTSRAGRYILTPAVAYSLGLAAPRVGGTRPARRQRRAT